MKSAPREGQKEKTPGEGGGYADGVIPSDALLRGRQEVKIAHAGTLYLLRQTRAGKLILTK